MKERIVSAFGTFGHYKYLRRLSTLVLTTSSVNI